MHSWQAREPSGLIRTDGRGPDGLTHTPFERGKAMVWYGTVADALALSNVSYRATQPVCAVLQFEQCKLQKYADLQRTHIFSLIAFVTLGRSGPLTKQLMVMVAGLLIKVAGTK